MSTVKKDLGTKLVGIIGNEDTVTGFLLTGIGKRDARGQNNFFVVKPETTRSQIEDAFATLTARKDIGILLINQTVASEIRYIINHYDSPSPTILEIPSKEQPYDETKDSVMIRVRALLGVRAQKS